ncbi:MAG: hypothetical protein AABZ31_04200 [Bdellovibrionota bacterium]
MRSTKVSAAKESSAKIVSKSAQNPERNTDEKGEILVRTSRDKYLLEKDRIKHEIGSLTEIREALGLSQRKICQLLLVDPSAWTRWNKTEAPPHIYQALKWMLELKKVNPEAIGPTDMSSRLDYVQSSTQSKIKELEAHVQTLERALTLTPPSQPPSDYIIEAALRSQEQRFQQEIENLKQSFKQMMEEVVAKNSLALQLKAKRTKPKPISKKSKAPPKKISKKSVRKSAKKMKSRIKLKSKKKSTKKLAARKTQRR